MNILKPKLQPFGSKRIYWAVEQVEQEAGDIDTLHLDDNSFYIKSKVDAVIAELEERVRKERSAKIDYKISANDLSDGLRDTLEENRKLKRALWLARAERAMAESYSVLNDVPTSNKWVKALNKLSAKAEVYK